MSEVVNETPSIAADAGAWTDWCKGRLALYEKAANADPLTNPVWRLAYDRGLKEVISEAPDRKSVV